MNRSAPLSCRHSHSSNFNTSPFKIKLLIYTPILGTLKYTDWWNGAKQNSIWQVRFRIAVLLHKINSHISIFNLFNAIWKGFICPENNYKWRKGSWNNTRSYKKTCQTWSGLVNRDHAAWASRCRTGNRRGSLSALYCARPPQRTGTGRALALNAAAPRGYRRPRQESSRAGAARSLCPTAAGTGGTLALPYPAHSYALLTQQTTY